MGRRVRKTAHGAEGYLEGKKRAPESAVEHGERILKLARELEKEKKEYRDVANCIYDMQKIEGISGEDLEEIKEAAHNILSSGKLRKMHAEHTPQLSQAKFARIEVLEEEMPDQIKRMRENEDYQSMVRRDMDQLEGEKGDLQYQIETVRLEQKLIARGSWILVALFVAAMIAFVLIGSYFNYDERLPMLLTVLIAGICGVLIFLRMQSNRRKLIQIETNMNHAITLLNQMKTKYVNVTNALDFAKEKFQVSNSRALLHLWEQYQKEVQNSLAYEKVNDDLRYYRHSLVRVLKLYDLYDAEIWTRQASLILSKREMEGARQHLLQRRASLKTEIERRAEELRLEKEELLLLFKEEHGYYEQIAKVLQTVDRISALSQ